MPLNALTYANITNNLSEIAQKFVVSRTFSGQIDMSKEKQIFNDILDNTTIKRACCLRNTTKSKDGDNLSITVKIPLPSDSTYDLSCGSGATECKKYNYIEKKIDIPKTMCNNLAPDESLTQENNIYKKVPYTNNSNECAKFMAVYCENVKEYYKKTLDKKAYTPAEFSLFSPQCACYGDPDGTLTVSPSVSPVCYLPSCLKSSEVAFHAPFKECDSVMCTNIIDLRGATVGGNVNVNAKQENKCDKIGAPMGTPTPAPTVAGATTKPAPTVAGATTKPAPTVADATTKPAPTVAGATTKPALTMAGETDDKKTKQNQTIIIIVVIVCIIICSSCCAFYVMKKKGNNGSSYRPYRPYRR